MSKKIIFSSGGTGGHIFPTINLMKYFSNKGYKVLLVTDKRGNNFLINNHTKIKSHIINTDTPTNKNFIQKILPFIKIFYSIIKSIIILKKEKPKIIFGFGGYVSFPISFASRFFNIPLIIYENNLILGRTNKKLLPLSKKILIGSQIPTNLPKRYISKIFKVGNILSENIVNYQAPEKKYLYNNFSILVLGGSQAAEIFGQIIPTTIKMIKDQGHKIEINQQCIPSQKNLINEFYNKNNIKNNVFSFTNDVLSLIKKTDLAISRCGASTLAELTHTLTPFIAVPYPHSIDNHQYLNAKYYESKGCCWILEQNNFNSENLFNLIMTIMKNKEKLKNVHESMKKNDSKNVYNNIESAIKEFV